MAEQVRNSMKQFWTEHSVEASEEDMMLDSQASEFSKYEREEILGMLGDYSGKDILELGAGIGRYTGILGETAGRVVAVDFMQKFCDKNKENHIHMNNVEVLCADVVELRQPDHSFDIIFSNWLFMYLSDDELSQVLKRILTWLKPGGVLFFRESCFHQSGDKKRSSNPSKYRTPEYYNNFLKAANTEENQKIFGYDINFTRSVQTYIRYKKNPNQLCWMASKVVIGTGSISGHDTFQQFLDNQQYSRNGILRYEKIFGKHFVSTGGLTTTSEFVEKLNLKEGEKVLDVGAGIGGSAFHMAEKYGASVLGIDLSTNMIAIAFERAHDIGLQNVTFEVADATTRQFPDSAFDVVYSRDTILHIEDKLALFKSFYKWLKPGGRVLISDYCCGEKPHSEEFKKYVEKRGYNLLTPPEYGKVLEAAGFSKVVAEDRTQQFLQVLDVELAKLETIKNEFLREFSEDDLNAIANGWKDKLRRCTEGSQRWGLFMAWK